MQAEAAAKLDLLLIPESYITPSQYQDSRVGNQVRLTADQRLILAVLADGIEAFKDADPEAIAERQGEKKLIHGPKLDEDVGHASQDDIDALFG